MSQAQYLKSTCVNTSGSCSRGLKLNKPQSASSRGSSKSNFQQKKRKRNLDKSQPKAQEAPVQQDQNISSNNILSRSTGGDNCSSNQSDIRLSDVSSEDQHFTDKDWIVGIIIAISKRYHKIFTATGVLVGSNILLTCTHALQINQQQYCDYFIFIPGCSEKTAIHHYKRQKIDQTMFLSSAQVKGFQNMRIGRELALIKLDEEYDIRSRKVEVIGIDEMIDKKIEIVGYSNAKITYNSQNDTIQKQSIKREQLDGEYVSINTNEHEICYDLPTNSGLSGAPIFAKFKNKNGTLSTGIVGIHTHGVKTVNLLSKGLAFTKQIKTVYSDFYSSIQNSDVS